MPTIDTCSQSQLTEQEHIGCRVLDEYMEAFNSREVLRWASILHYPHVRIAGERIIIWNTPTEFAKDNDLSKLQKKINWGYNKWDWRHLVQFGPAKMHFAVQLSRHDVNGAVIGAYESLYIITRVGARWGVQGRSSYGGVLGPNTSF